MGFNLADVLSDVPKLDTNREQIEYIKLDLIDADPNNFYQLSGVENLAANIQLCGLQQPIRVRKHPAEAGRYMVISGHRRREAVTMLAKDDPDKWNEVACIIEEVEVSPALQQLRLIYANSNTRAMTNAELSEQAVQVEKLLYQLKEEGYEFPGRMRDHVAQAVNASKTKLARLKVIRGNLDECWMPHFESNALHESTAYYLSQLSKEEQFFIYDYMEGAKGSASSVSAAIVEAYKDRIGTMTGLICLADGAPCENMDNKREATIRTGLYDIHPCGQCCASCYRLTSCRYACPKLADQIAQQKAEHLAETRARKAAEAEKSAPVIEAITRIWRRFGELRRESGTSVESVRKVLGSSCVVSDKEFTEQERGKHIGTGTSLPFGSILRYEVERLIDLADLFGCSLDYLLCRTDVREMAQPAQEVSDSGAIWHPISEEPPVNVNLVWLDGRGYSDTAEYNGGGKISIVSTISWEEARYWAYLPEEEE